MLNKLLLMVISDTPPKLRFDVAFTSMAPEGLLIVPLIPRVLFSIIKFYSC